MTEKPIRVQRRRTRGWVMPPNTVYVGRGSKWGNPFTADECRAAGYAGTDAEIASRCAEAFRAWLGLHWPNNWDGPVLALQRKAILDGLEKGRLRGKNLACWCHLCDKHKDGKPLGVKCPDCQPCHADVLLEMANAT